MLGLKGIRSPRQMFVKNPAPPPDVFVMDRNAARPPLNCATSVKKWDEVMLRLGELRKQLLFSASRGDASIITVALGLNEGNLASWVAFEALAQLDENN
ncbi:hypothetical protein CF326_g5978 [Tilletia indica]|nr:hypothetical protein CF326_g5978 [Tilletia indica]